MRRSNDFYLAADTERMYTTQQPIRDCNYYIRERYGADASIVSHADGVNTMNVFALSATVADSCCVQLRHYSKARRKPATAWI